MLYLAGMSLSNPQVDEALNKGVRTIYEGNRSRDSPKANIDIGTGQRNIFAISRPRSFSRSMLKELRCYSEYSHACGLWHKMKLERT